MGLGFSDELSLIFVLGMKNMILIVGGLGYHKHLFFNPLLRTLFFSFRLYGILSNTIHHLHVAQVITNILAINTGPFFSFLQKRISSWTRKGPWCAIFGVI